jgi:hypothetical protein
MNNRTYGILDISAGVDGYGLFRFMELTGGGKPVRQQFERTPWTVFDF